jgi:hypothetical protein
MDATALHPSTAKGVSSQSASMWRLTATSLKHPLQLRISDEATAATVNPFQKSRSVACLNLA